MPTAITAPIYDGTQLTLREFLLRYLNATTTGALLDAPFEPNVVAPSRQREVDELQLKLFAFDTTDDEVLDLIQRSKRDELIARLAEFDADAQEKRNYYRRMIALVSEWLPPTAAHEDFRRNVLAMLQNEHDKLDLGFEVNPIMPIADYRAMVRARMVAELKRVCDEWEAAKIWAERQTEWNHALLRSLEEICPST